MPCVQCAPHNWQFATTKSRADELVLVCQSTAAYFTLAINLCTCHTSSPDTGKIVWTRGHCFWDCCWNMHAGRCNVQAVIDT